MGAELEVADLIAEFLAFGLEEKLNPANVVLGRVGVGDFLAKTGFHLEHFIGRDGIGAFDYGHMLFGFPIGGLKQFSNGWHSVSSLQTK
jgi:hypothetical protein